MDQKQALIAMSGGVDSSVAAYLTQCAGYRCMGATMRLYDNRMTDADQGSTCEKHCTTSGNALLCIQFHQRFPGKGHRQICQLL